jgi:prepilin-type N-terminal cleavage/methylation domain-containing protein
MRSIPAFTLIELLVVITIMGVLSSLSVVSIGSARGRARTTTAKTAVTSAGRAVEGCRGEVGSGVISNVPDAGSDTLNGSAGTLPSIFTGQCDGASLTYPARISKTPSNAYTYTYRVLEYPTPTDLRSLLSEEKDYRIFSNLPDSSEGYYVAEKSGVRTSLTDPNLVSFSAAIDFTTYGEPVSFTIDFRAITAPPSPVQFSNPITASAVFVPGNVSRVSVNLPPGLYYVEGRGGIAVLPYTGTGGTSENSICTTGVYTTEYGTIYLDLRNGTPTSLCYTPITG